MTDRMLSAVVVGTEFGARLHVPALRAAGFDVVAIVGRDADKASAKAGELGIPSGTDDLDAALDLGPDVVTVAVPPAMRGPILSSASSRGCHLLCEKPFARSLAEARAQLKIVSDAGVTGIVGYEFRFTAENILVDRLIRDGAVGTPQYFTSCLLWGRTADPLAPTPDWWWDPDGGGGWLNVATSHTIDQAMAWLGPIDRLSAHLRHTSQRDAPTEDTVSIQFETATAVGSIQQSSAIWGAQAYAPTTTISGSEGSLTITSGRVALGDRTGTREIEIPADLRTEHAATPHRSNSWQQPHLELAPYTRMLTAWRRMIEQGLRPGDGEWDGSLPGFSDAVRSTAVLEAVHASRGHALTIDG
jgi:predicted dehydrogenase